MGIQGFSEAVAECVERTSRRVCREVPSDDFPVDGQQRDLYRVTGILLRIICGHVRGLREKILGSHLKNT